MVAHPTAIGGGALYTNAYSYSLLGSRINN